jgi:transcriptional regulator with XRE-family HTH domain
MAHMDLCSVIGSNVRKMRKAKRLSQEELAFRAEIDRSYLSEVENGHKNLSVTMLDQIAAALGVDLRELLEGYKRAPRRSD